MKRLCSLILFSLIGLARLAGAPASQSVEDDLDAIVPQKKPAAAKTQVEAKPAKPDAIALKPDPTAKDVARYLDALLKDMKQKFEVALANVAGGRIMLPRETAELIPQLDAIPTPFIGEMLQRADDENSGPLSTIFRTKVVSSINGRHDLSDSQREIILKALPDLPALIETVTKHGWEKGAEATIIKTVKRGKITSSTPFVTVLAAYGTPPANKALTELLKNARPEDVGKNLTALAETTVPGLDLNDLVAKAWKSAQNNSERPPTTTALIAARYGHLDALLYLTKRLNGAPNPYDRFDNNIRANILDALQQLVPDGGTDEKSLISYVLANRTQFVFDPTRKEFHLPK